MATLTVTASQSGAGSANGMALTVKVVTGAVTAAAQNGATVQNNSSITTAQISITPHATGSVVYGATTNGASSSNFTPLANTTYFANISDAVNGAGYGTLRGTSTTTAATPVTLGASAPASGAGATIIALAEILAATVLAENASSPASVSTTGAKTVTTALFSPPPGSLLVAMVSNDYSGTGTNTISVADTLGLSWIRLVQDSYTTASVWIAQVPGSASTAAIVQQVSGGETNDYGIGTTAITTTAGNTLVVYAGWQATSFGSNVQIPAISVSDSAGNLWKQLDISSPSGTTTETRGAIWAAVNATSVNWVSVSVTGATLAVSWLITEISGLAQNIALDFALAQNGTGSSSALTGYGSGQGVGLAVAVGAGSALTVTTGPIGWTALNRVAQGNSVYGVSMMPYWNPGVTQGSSATSFTFNGADNNNVLYCQLLADASPPAQYDPKFPLTIVEAAFGATPGLVSSSTEFTYSSENVIWTDISTRVIGGPAEGRMTASRGKQYELSQAEAGTLELTLDNHDGALIPTYPGSPYYSNAINSNMSFQLAVAPWQANDGAHLSLSNAFTFASGQNAVAQFSLLLTPDGLSFAPGMTDTTFYPVNLNYSYSFSCWVLCPVGYGSGVETSIAWYNSSFAQISAPTSGTFPLSAGVWTQVTQLNATPPAGAAYAQITFLIPSTPSAATLFYVAEAAFVQGSSAVRTGLVALLTPIRVTTWWNGVQYPVWQGFVEQWPQSWPEMPQWGFSKVVAIDAVGVMSSITMNSALISDVLIDNPYAYLPCNETYTTAIVGSTPQFQFMFGTSPYYSPSDANGLNALNKALTNQTTGVYSDGQANVPVNTGVSMNFFGDDSTGVGATSYNGPLSGHRGPCMIYTDPGLAAISSTTEPFTVEFWFTWSGAVNTSINLFTMYGVPSSFWYNGANTFNGANVLVWIKVNGASNNLAVTLNQATTLGPTITPSTTPQHVVIVFNPSGVSGFSLYVNGTFITQVVTGSFNLNTYAIGLGPATYSYDCANSTQVLGAAYTSNNYSAGHLAFYGYQLADGRISSHYQTGVAGFSGVSAAFRFAQVISWALTGIKRGGYYTLDATGVAEATQIGPAYSLNGSSAADGVNSVQQSEGGQFYVKADGTATYIERQYSYNSSNNALIGDNATSDTVPLNTNTAFTNGVTGWSAFNGTLVSSGTAYAGNGSGFFTPSGSGGTATAFTSTFPATPLIPYNAGSWILSPGGYGSMQTVVTWLNGSGGTVSSTNGSTFAIPANSWFFTSLAALAPVGAVSGKFGISEVSSPGTVNTFYISYASVIRRSPEVPFLKETEFGFDNTYLYNEVTSTQQDGPNQVITADYRDTTSQGEYFRRSALSFQQNVVSPYDVADITTWSATQYKQPSIHLNTVKIHASGNPLVSFPIILGLDIGDIVTVTRRPTGGGSVTTMGIIERVQVEIGSRYWFTTYQISPYAPQGNVLCADTAGLNTPATTILGW